MNVSVCLVNFKGLMQTPAYRKVPLLRVCFGQRDGEMWIREMAGEALDFEVSRSCDSV